MHDYFEFEKKNPVSLVNSGEEKKKKIHKNHNMNTFTSK